ncbi:LamG domain-containing protein [Kiritimatiellota bacterium B12222]|nr:LamG domain-containing protein [Kiritimatiellota bacterium B12222]
MKKPPLLYFITLIAGFAGNIFASDSKLDEGLTLYLPWDSSTEAVIAAGDKTPNKDQDTKLVEGKFGNGVALTGDARLYYPGKDNFNIQEGTIAFWAKRNASWKQDEAGFIMVKAVAGGIWDQNSLYFSITRWKQIRLGIFDSHKHQTIYMVRPVPAQENVWYHLVATFKDGEVHVYLNGEEGSYTNDGQGDPMLIMPTGDVKFLQIGSDYNHSFEGILDEFRVYNRALSPEDVKALYELKP